MSYKSSNYVWLRGDPMEQEMLIYLDVDEQGNVTACQGGTNTVPEKEYDYFFIRDKLTLDNIRKFKVVINDYKPNLILKDGEVLEEVIDTPDSI